MNSRILRIFLRSLFNAIKKLTELVALSFNAKKMKDVLTSSISGVTLVGRKVDVENYTDIESLSENLNKIILHTRLSESSTSNILDVGANLGFYSLAFAKNPRTYVLAYEPYTESYNYLKSNIKNNSMANIKPINAGLSDENEKLFLGPPFYKGRSTRFFKYFDRYSLGSRTIHTDKKASRADCLSSFYIGDDHNEIRDLNTLGVIKIDVEGSEMKVLKGLNETIKKYHPAIMIEINNNYNTDEIFNFLIEKGYDQFLDFSLLNDSNVLSQIKNINLLDQNLSQEKIALDMVFFKSD